VQTGHELGGLKVRGVLWVELVVLVTGDEREVADVLVQFLEGKLNAGWKAGEEG